MDHKDVIIQDLRAENKKLTEELEQLKSQPAACDLISRQEAIDRLSEVLYSEAEFEKAKQVIIEAPTVDEKEIIRKAFERVVEKLCDLQPFLTADGQYVSLYEVVQTIKKECGINE